MDALPVCSALVYILDCTRYNLFKCLGSVYALDNLSEMFVL